MLDILKPADIAALLESSPPHERGVIWNLIDSSRQSEILQELNEERVSDLLADLPENEIIQLLDNVEADDDLTDILQQLPDTITREVLHSMDHQDRARVENLLAYDENTAGGLMDTEIISVRASVSIDVVLRYLRRHDEIPTMTDNIFIVNRYNQYIGTLPLRKLLVSETGLTVRDVMETDTDPINADMHDSDVAAIFARYDLVSAPVVDDQGQLLGRITIDDVVDVIIEDADQSLLGMAGLSDDDTFAPIVTTVKSRTLWLGANLFTAFIASAVINIFEDTLEKVIALAVLMPIVASMGGVAGSQTLTVVIRSMAQGHIIESNQRWLLMREVGVGIANGLIWSGVVAIAAAAMFNDTTLGFIIALALIINLISAALAGATIPMTLKRLGIDPAIAGTVILTTVTDVVGFVSFLGLATIFYA